MTYGLRRIGVAFAVLGPVALLAGCADATVAGGHGVASTVLPGAPVDYRSLTSTLNGSGSSFQDALEQVVAGEFAGVAPRAKVNYSKSGSSAGRQDLRDGIVHFAGTDTPIIGEKRVEFDRDLLHFPIASAPITVSYTLRGVNDLRLDAATIAGIFQRRITRWNDRRITALNPGADLPATEISVVHRSDGSGTTGNFSRFLHVAAPTTWRLGTGDSIAWPSHTQGAEKNSGVAAMVKTTEGAVGYVDLVDSATSGLQRALVRNAAGRFVAPKLPGAKAAVDASTVARDLTFDPVDAPGPDSYPITSPTWVVVDATQPDRAVASALRAYLNFMLTRGQEVAPSVGYASLPESLRRRAIAQLDRIVAP
ncbi:MAG: phosphate ABC transporter substrate-binding protein PstS [Microthrixaceae bacterium]